MGVSWTAPSVKLSNSTGASAVLRKLSVAVAKFRVEAMTASSNFPKSTEPSVISVKSSTESVNSAVI